MIQYADGASTLKPVPVSPDNPLPVTVVSGGTGGGAVTVADGADVTQGAKADAKSTATDATPVTIMQVLKQISASVQAPPSQAVTNAGTFATQSTLAAGSALVGKVGIDQTTPGTTNAVAATNLPTTVDTNSGNKSASTLRVVLATDQVALTNPIPVDGGTASGSSIANAPVTVGGRAATANPTAVADGQVVNAMFDKVGRLVVVKHVPRALATDQKTTISNSTAETTIGTAIASTFLDMLSLTLVNSGATPTKVDLRDTTGGAIRWTGYVPAGDMRGIVFQVPLTQTTVNTNWTLQCSAATTALEASAQFAKNI